VPILKKIGHKASICQILLLTLQVVCADWILFLIFATEPLLAVSFAAWPNLVQLIAAQDIITEC